MVKFWVYYWFSAPPCAERSKTEQGRLSLHLVLSILLGRVTTPPFRQLFCSYEHFQDLPTVNKQGKTQVQRRIAKWILRFTIGQDDDGALSPSPVPDAIGRFCRGRHYAKLRARQDLYRLGDGYNAGIRVSFPKSFRQRARTG